MNKIFCLILLLITSHLVHAQNICVRVDCKDTIRYPQDTVTLNAIVTTSDGIKSVFWNGTTGVTTIDNPSTQATVARGLSKGGNLFVFLFTGTTNKGAVGAAFDSVVYIPNKPPVAVTGQTVNTSVNTAVLSGSNSSDPEGMPLAFLWAQVSGPNTSTINTPTMSNPIVSGLINGTYSYRLLVTDKGGMTSSATQTVNVTTSPVQIKTTITTTVVTTKFYSDGSTKVTTSTNTITTVP